MPGTTSSRERTDRATHASRSIALAELRQLVAQYRHRLVLLLVRAARLRIEDGADDRAIALGHDVAVGVAVADVAHVDAVEVGLDLAVEAHPVLQRHVRGDRADAERAAHDRAGAVGADEVLAATR